MAGIKTGDKTIQTKQNYIFPLDSYCPKCKKEVTFEPVYDVPNHIAVQCKECKTVLTNSLSELWDYAQKIYKEEITKNERNRN